MQVTFPSTIALHAGMSPGTLLTDFVGADGHARWTCSYSRGEQLGLFFNGAHPEIPGTRIQANGLSYAVFPTNLPDIGMLIELSASVQTEVRTTQDGPVAMVGVSRMVTPVSDAGQTPAQVTFMMNAIRLALVYLGGKQRHASALTGNVIGHVGIGLAAQSSSQRATMDATYAVRYNTVQFITPTCTVPDVTVNMPPHVLRQFNGLQERTGQWQSFAVNVQHCPAGIQTLRYRFIRPATGLLDEANQVMRAGYADNMMAAKGIGIQLASDDAQGAVIHYGVDRVERGQGYASAYGGAFALPFKARYVKPAGRVATAGNIHASVVFELNYD